MHTHTFVALPLDDLLDGDVHVLAPPLDLCALGVAEVQRGPVVRPLKEILLGQHAALEELVLRKLKLQAVALCVRVCVCVRFLAPTSVRA